MSSGQPNECCTRPGWCFSGCDLPELLEADAELLRLAACVELEARDQLLGERAAHALADQHVLAVQLHAAREAGPGLPSLSTPMSPVATPITAPFVVVEHLGGGEARIDLDAQRLGLGRQPAADIAERDDVVAVVVHQRRHHEIRQRGPRRVGRATVELVVRHRRLERVVAPRASPGSSRSSADGIDHRAGQDMRADLGALFQHHDGSVSGVELLQPDRRREARRARRRRSPRRTPSSRAAAARVRPCCPPRLESPRNRCG